MWKIVIGFVLGVTVTAWASFDTLVVKDGFGIVQELRANRNADGSFTLVCVHEASQVPEFQFK
jgi:hypothetical protein